MGPDSAAVECQAPANVSLRSRKATSIFVLPFFPHRQNPPSLLHNPITTYNIKIIRKNGLILMAYLIKIY